MKHIKISKMEKVLILAYKDCKTWERVKYARREIFHEYTFARKVIFYESKNIQIKNWFKK